MRRYERVVPPVTAPALPPFTEFAVGKGGTRKHLMGGGQRLWCGQVASRQLRHGDPALTREMCRVCASMTPPPGVRHQQP